MQKIKNINLKKLKSLYLEEIIKVIFIFSVLQVCLIAVNFTLEISFIYCPLIYLYKRNVNGSLCFSKRNRLLIKHLFLYFLTVLISIIASDFWFLFLMFFYYTVYSFLIIKELNGVKRDRVVLYSNSKPIVSLYLYFVILGAAIVILKITQYYYGNIVGISLRFITIWFLGVNILFSIIFLLSLCKNECKNIENEKIEVTSELGITILNFFRNSELYLNSNFGLHDLAKILGTRKEVVTLVLKQEIKMNFCTLVAKHRIKYAKKLLLAPENIKIEVIVELSGFRSKSTFNKYFHAFVELKPSEYRKNNSVL